jgi:hypothetical protein
MRPSHANGAHAVVAWRAGVAFGVAVLGIRDGGLARISLFTEPAVVERFVRSTTEQMHTVDEASDSNR